MRKTPYILTFCALLLPALLQYANWVNANKNSVGPFNPVNDWVQHHFAGVVLGIAIGSFGISALKELPGLVGFRRRTIQAALDQFVNENCTGLAKENRLTVFRQVTGFRAFFSGLRRLAFQRRGSRWKKWCALREIRWTSQYLTVFARTSDARGQRSTAAFAISDDADACEGVAGKAWDQGFYVACDLPRLTVEQFRSVSDIASLPADHPVREYAEKTHVGSIAQLHAIAHPAYHFMGSEIRVGKRLWGVLLLDSERAARPFPDPAKKKDGGEFGRKFKSCATMISHFLS